MLPSGKFQAKSPVNTFTAKPSEIFSSNNDIWVVRTHRGVHNEHLTRAGKLRIRGRLLSADENIFPNQDDIFRRLASEEIKPRFSWTIL